MSGTNLDLTQSNLNMRLQSFCDQENKRFSKVYVLAEHEEIPKPGSMPEDVIFIQKTQNNVVAYWYENSEIKQKTLNKKLVSNKIKKFSEKINQVSSEKELIDSVNSTYGPSLDISFLNEEGNCSGWAVLFNYYASIGKLDEFEEIRKYIAKWSMNNEKFKPLKPPLSESYKDGQDLFTHLINDLVWFQNSRVTELQRTQSSRSLAQHERTQQYNIIGNDRISLTSIASFSQDSGSKINDNEFISILKVCSRWQESFIDILVDIEGVGAHVVGAYVSSDGELMYFDSNSSDLKKKTLSPEECLETLKKLYKPNPVKIQSVGLNKFHSSKIPSKNVIAEHQTLSTFDKSMFKNILEKSISASEPGFLKIFLKEGLSGNDLDTKEKERVISFLSSNTSFDTIKVLIEAKFDINNIFQQMYKIGAYEHVHKILKEHIPKDKRADFIKDSKVICNISPNTDVKMLKLLCKYGANVNQNDNGLMPLHSACHLSKSDIIEFLVQNHADTNVPYLNSTPLHSMVSVKNLSMETIEAAITDENINAQDAHGFTPLHLAVKTKNIDFIKAILDSKCKADLNINDKRGWTALHYVSASKDMNPKIQKEIIQLLRVGGADISSKSSSNSKQTPSEKAKTEAARYALRENTLNKRNATFNLSFNNPINTTNEKGKEKENEEILPKNRRFKRKQ